MATETNISDLNVARGLRNVTKGDTEQTQHFRALWVGGVGDLVVKGKDGTEATLTNFSGWLWAYVTHVMDATTATDIVGLI